MGLKGVPVMLAGYLLFGLVPVFVRQAREYEWGVGHTLIARFGFALLAVILISIAAKRMGATGLTLRPHNIRLLVWRGIFGGSAVLCYFAAIQYLGAGKGTLLNYTHSIFANLFAVLFLAHRPPRIFWAYLALGIAGLYLLINPSFDRVSWPELLGLLSGVFGGGAILCIKRLRESDNALTIFTSLSIGGLVFALPALFLEPGARLWSLTSAQLEINGWMALLAMAALSMAGQMLFTHGYKQVPISLGSVMSLTTPVMAALTGWYFLDEQMTLWTLAGGCLILTASLLTGLMEHRREAIPD